MSDGIHNYHTPQAKMGIENVPEISTEINCKCIYRKNNQYRTILSGISDDDREANNLHSKILRYMLP